MKKKKFTLKQLKISSFITSESQRNINGGDKGSISDNRSDSHCKPTDYSGCCYSDGCQFTDNPQLCYTIQPCDGMIP
ncbi:pinensin family lanthipeptide [Fulvivirga imtechensis]|uniref:pinensin family lanthipeptide n=1 Tax=Fulvivirga imtechensis TaxID=881893 RepID=UPI0003104F81|nr:pinensin family lanthipeptide [Fulvivirga imtechensis]